MLFILLHCWCYCCSVYLSQLTEIMITMDTQTLELTYIHTYVVRSRQAQSRLRRPLANFICACARAALLFLLTTATIAWPRYVYHLVWYLCICIWLCLQCFVLFNVNAPRLLLAPFLSYLSTWLISLFLLIHLKQFIRVNLKANKQCEGDTLPTVHM